MSDWLEGVGLALIGAILAFLLREMGVGVGRTVSVLAILGLTALSVKGFAEIKDALEEMALPAGSAEIAANIMKPIGIGYVFGVSSDICRELGEGGVANALLAIGRVEILLVSIPFIKDVIASATRIVS